MFISSSPPQDVSSLEQVSGKDETSEKGAKQRKVGVEYTTLFEGGSGLIRYDRMRYD